MQLHTKQRVSRIPEKLADVCPCTPSANVSLLIKASQKLSDLLAFGLCNVRLALKVHLMLEIVEPFT